MKMKVSKKIIHFEKTFDNVFRKFAWNASIYAIVVIIYVLVEYFFDSIPKEIWISVLGVALIISLIGVCVYFLGKWIEEYNHKKPVWGLFLIIILLSAVVMSE